MDSTTHSAGKPLYPESKLRTSSPLSLAVQLPSLGLDKQQFIARGGRLYRNHLKALWMDSGEPPPPESTRNLDHILDRSVSHMYNTLKLIMASSLTPPGPSQEQGSLAPAGGRCSGCQPELCGVVCGFSSVGLRVKLWFREVGGGGKGCRLGTNIATPQGPAFEKAAGNMQGLSWRMRQAPQDQA